MPALAKSLMLAIGQLADTRIIRVLLKSIAISLLLFALLAVGGWYLFDMLLSSAGLNDSLFIGSGPLREAASLVLALAGLWLLWRIVAMAVIQFYADEVVEAVEARHYPQAALTRRDVPLAEDAGNALRSALRSLIAKLVALPFALILLFTGVGTAAVFWIVNAVLIGRELQDMVWMKHRRDKSDAAPIARAQRLLLGAAITALLALPVLNFIAPVIGAASATHLVHRRLRDA